MLKLLIRCMTAIRTAAEREVAVRDFAYIVADTGTMLGALTCGQADILARMFALHGQWEIAELTLVRHAVEGLEDDDADLHGDIHAACRAADGTYTSNLAAYQRGARLAHGYVRTLL